MESNRSFLVGFLGEVLRAEYSFEGFSHSLSVSEKTFGGRDGTLGYLARRFVENGFPLCSFENLGCPASCSQALSDERCKLLVDEVYRLYREEERLAIC